ncbi:MAG: GNAT family N-acetyltransferase [Hymenobacter sp.]
MLNSHLSHDSAHHPNAAAHAAGHQPGPAHGGAAKTAVFPHPARRSPTPGWPPAPPAARAAALARTLGVLTAGGRDAAGWYDWYALRKPDDAAPRTLIGTASFLGPPDAAGRAEITAYLVPEWRGQGLGTELVAGLVQQAAATGLVRQLVAHVPPEDLIPQRTLLANGFTSTGTDVGGRLRFERAVEPAAVLPPALPAS